MQVIEKVKVVPEGYNGAGIDCYIPKERLLNNSSLSFLFKIKFYICCVI